jgi:hypothetical protein
LAQLCGKGSFFRGHFPVVPSRPWQIERRGLPAFAGAGFPLRRQGGMGPVIVINVGRQHICFDF